MTEEEALERLKESPLKKFQENRDYKRTWKEDHEAGKHPMALWWCQLCIDNEDLKDLKNAN